MAITIFLAATGCFQFIGVVLCVTAATQCGNAGPRLPPESGSTRTTDRAASEGFSIDEPSPWERRESRSSVCAVSFGSHAQPIRRRQASMVGASTKGSRPDSRRAFAVDVLKADALSLDTLSLDALSLTPRA
jgi:hypothetical protein